jgi:chaperonin GroEL
MKMSKEKDLALLVIANEYTADIMQLLVVNRLRGKVRVCAIKGPGYGKRRTEQLEDVAALAGAAVISPEAGHDLRKLKFEQLGIVASVVVDRNTTLMRHAGGGKEAIDQRVKQLEAMLVATGPSMSDYDREKLNERIARLTSGVAVVAVGGATAMETKERCYRIEDAIHATRAAIEGGTLTGGGFPLLVAGRLLKEVVRKEKLDWLPTHEHGQGAMILATALAVPAKLIIENSGEDPEKILARIGDLRKVPFTGWDSSVGKICDLREAGILDPLKVVREALVNAVSAATMMLTTEVMIVEVGEIFGADQLK